MYRTSRNVCNTPLLSIKYFHILNAHKKETDCCYVIHVTRLYIFQGIYFSYTYISYSLVHFQEGGNRVQGYVLRVHRIQGWVVNYRSGVDFQFALSYIVQFSDN